MGELASGSSIQTLARVYREATVSVSVAVCVAVRWLVCRVSI